MPFGVGQVVQVQAVHQFGRAARVGQQAGNHHHHPVLGRDASGQREPWQRARSHRFTDQPVDHRDDRLGGGEQRQRGQQAGERSTAVLVVQQPGHQAHGQQAQGTEVDRQRQPLERVMAGNEAVVVQTQGVRQRDAARSRQPVEGNAGVDPARITVHQSQQGLGHLGLGLAAAPGQLLDAVQALIACVGVF